MATAEEKLATALAQLAAAQAQLAASQAASQAQLAASQAQTAALQAQLTARVDAEAQPAATLPASEDADRDMRREANSLLSRVKSGGSMRALLASLAGNVPSKRLTRIQLKRRILEACTEMKGLSDTASKQSPLIKDTDIFKGLMDAHDEFSKLESEVTKASYTTKLEFHRTVRLLNTKPLQLELPSQSEPDDSAMSADDAQTVAASTDDGSEGGLSEGEETDATTEVVIDVERTQPPPADSDAAKVREAFDLIMGCPSLRKKLRFDLAPFLRRVHENISNGLDACRQMEYGVIDASETAKMFGGGKTQARKTPLKLCAFVLCRMMGVSTVLLTTNVSGREDLFTKFIELLGDLTVPAPPATIPTNANDAQYRYYQVKEPDNGGRASIKLMKVTGANGATALPEGVFSVSDVGRDEGKKRWASRQLSQGACVIVNNAAAAIEKASGLIERARGMCTSSRVPPVQFMLTIDEADDFYRTDTGSGSGDSQEREIKMEEQMRLLKDIGPLCQFEVTAPTRLRPLATAALAPSPRPPSLPINPSSPTYSGHRDASRHLHAAAAAR